MNKDIRSCIVKINYVRSVLTGINGDIREGMPGRAIKIAEKDLPGLIKILEMVEKSLRQIGDEDAQ